MKNILSNISKYIFLFVLISCIPSGSLDFSQTEVIAENTELALPLAKAKLGIIDLLNQIDTSNIRFGAETAQGRPIFFVYFDTLFSSGITEVVTIPDISFSETFEFPTIDLPNINSSVTLSFGDILASNAILTDGLSPIPAFTLPQTVDFELSLSNSSNFTFITFESGSIDITATNNTETPLSFALQLRNNTGANEVIGVVTFTSIPVNGSQTQSIALADQTLRNEIDFSLINFRLEGSQGSLNYSDGVNLQFVFNNPVYRQASVRLTEPLNFSRSTVLDLSQNNIELYRTLLRTGNLNYSIVSNLAPGLTGQLRFNLPDFTRNEQAIDESVTFRTGQTIAGSIVLDGTNVNFRNYTPDHSRINVGINVSLSTNDELIFTNGDQLQARFDITNFDYTLFEGYVPQQSIDLGQDSISLNFVDNTLRNGDFELAEIIINLIVENGYGIDFELLLSPARFQNNEGEQIDIQFSRNPNILEGGTLNNDIVTPTTTVFAIENVLDIINIRPNRFFYTASGVINPETIPKPTNFLTRESDIKILADVRVPLGGRIRNISSFVDFAVDFTNLTEIFDNILSVELRIYTDNGLPLNLLLQALILDNNDAVIDSIFTGDLPILGSSQVNDQGVTIANTQSTLDATIDLNALASARKIRMRVTSSTSNGGEENIFLYDTNDLEIELGIRIKGTYTTKSGGS